MKKSRRVSRPMGLVRASSEFSSKYLYQQQPKLWSEGCSAVVAAKCKVPWEAVSVVACDQRMLSLN